MQITLRRLAHSSTGSITRRKLCASIESSTAPKSIAVSNPIAVLLTAKLMLDWLKETEKAKRLEAAVARVIAEGKVRTYDMGGKDSTLDVAKAIANYATS